MPTCRQCDYPIPDSSPGGECPVCLLRLSLGPPPGEDDPLPAHDIAPLFPDLEGLTLLARGGMGVVYRAVQSGLGRPVALKLLAPRLAADPAFAERFLREARAMARLSHPRVVAVYSSGRVDDVVYILMEFVDGESLRHRLGAGRLPPAEALRIIPQLCDAVQYAHDRGVIHRDLKPENVLIDRAGNVKVADFGLAKLGDEDGSNLTGTGDRLGTARYMAPEQWAGSAAVDHRTDIYALGLLFYEVLTGELPAVQFTPPSAKAGTDRRLDRVVAKSLREKPADRYQRAAEVKADVDRIARTSRHRPAVFAAVGGVAVLLAVGVVVPVRRDPAPPTSLELAPPPRPAGVVPAAPESEWSAPENLGPDVNSAEDDGSPCVSADGRTLVFHSQRAGGLGLTDLWECRRATPADPFGPAVPLGPAVNTPDHDGEPALSADGLTMVFVSHRPGGHGGADLWQTRRPAVGAAWGDPVNLGPGVNSPRNEQRPSLQADGLTLTYTTGGGAVVARRPGPGRPFGNRAPFGPAEGLTELQFLSVSADGLSAVGNRPMNGRPALWTAARPAADVPFGPPELVLPTAVLGRGYDTSPAFSADKKTIFFTSNRPGGRGNHDLWMTRLVTNGK